MDDLIWVNPEPVTGVHDASTHPRKGWVLYARVDVLAEAERTQGQKRKASKEGGE